MKKTINLGVIGIDHGHIFDMLDEMLKEKCKCEYFWTEGDPLTLKEFNSKYPNIKRKENKEEILNDSSIDEITKKAIVGHRDNIDLLIGDVANNIGVLGSSVTASNFAKLKKADDVSEDDVAAALLNMIGEVIGTIAYLNAAICGVNKVHFIGRVSTNEYIKNAVDERLKLANMQGIFEDNREYGTVIGALKHIETK